MCGRYNYSAESPDEKNRAILDLLERYYSDQFKTGEIYPEDSAPAVIARQSAITAVPAQFGFLEYDKRRLIINARSETVLEKQTFSESMRSRRAILPATGFFEWSHKGKKTKYLFDIADQKTIYLCGLYRIVNDKYQFAILTRAANDSMIDIHDRMPVMTSETEV